MKPQSPHTLHVRRGRPVKDKIEPQPRYRTRDAYLRAMTDEERQARVRMPSLKFLSKEQDQ